MIYINKALRDVIRRGMQDNVMCTKIETQREKEREAGISGLTFQQLLSYLHSLETATEHGRHLIPRK